MPIPEIPDDVLNHVAGIEPGSHLARLRAERPRIVEHTQATFLAIFDPNDDSDLSRIERDALALWVATLIEAPEVAAFHRARLISYGERSVHLTPIGATVDQLDLSPRERALFRHTELITLQPASAEQSDVELLLSAGISPAAIVTLAQLVAFLSFEARTIATLQALDHEVTT